jgi:hypothetical protein
MYQLYFVAPRKGQRSVPPCPEGDKLETLQEAESLAAQLNELHHFLGVPGYYKTLLIN